MREIWKTDRNMEDRMMTDDIMTHKQKDDKQT